MRRFLRVLRSVALGLITGLAVGTGLLWLFTGDLPNAPSRAEICSTVGVINPLQEALPGVPVDMYCVDVDDHLNLPLGGSFGFEAAFVQPRPPSDPVQPRPDYLIWESDGCSAPVLGGGPFDFGLPCNRHDFGWRNLQELDATGPPVWHAGNKNRVDAGFLCDMRVECAGMNPFLASPATRRLGSTTPRSGSTLPVSRRWAPSSPATSHAGARPG